jgi:DNA-binding response OmpR family regulator
MNAADVTQSRRVLVVDDEVTIRTPLVRALELSGFQSVGVGSGKDALARLDRERFDVMLLDMKMPEMDGVEVMHHAHDIQPDLLILILTGHATLESAIAAVKSDAADYLLKPASIHDITTAITRAIDKRSEQERPKHLLSTILDTLHLAEHGGVEPATPTKPTPPTDWSKRPFLRVGPLTLDQEKRLLSIEDTGRLIELTEGEATILALFMEKSDRVLSCREIAHAAWSYELEEWEAQALVRPYIFRLRQKVEPAPSEPKIIRTVRGRGYLLAVD